MKTKVRRPNGFFSGTSNEEIYIWVFDRYRGKTLGEFKEDDASLYNVVCQRGIINELVTDGVLIRKINPNRFFLRMNNGILNDYITLRHRNKSIAQFASDDSRAYQIACKRGIIDELVQNGILQRNHGSRHITQGIKKKVILSLRKSAKSYFNIGLDYNISLHSVKRIASRAIGDGNLDQGYTRPNGALYLAIIRKESSNSLEGVLQNDQ